MKYVLLALIFALNLNCDEHPKQSMQKYFIKKSIDCDFANSETHKYYLLSFANDSIKTTDAFRCSYYFDFANFSEAEKLKMVEELLSYEGDTSLCSVKAKCYDPKRSQVVPAGIENYSVQVEALFIINHIIFSDPYSFSAFPILRSKNTDTLEAVNGPLVNQAYLLYRKWLDKAKESGLNKILAEGVFPMGDDQNVLWL